jgi:snRNA-activating protein complex subunit 3
MSRGFDSHFGPPSQPINVSEFLQQAGPSLLPAHPAWEQLSHEQKDAVEAEVTARYSSPSLAIVALIAHQRSISELKSSLEQVWDDPILSAHLLRQHESTVASVHDQADAPGTRKRKRKRLIAPEGGESAPGVSQLQDKLDAVDLRCWRYVSTFAYWSSLTSSRQVDSRVCALYPCCQEF